MGPIRSFFLRADQPVKKSSYGPHPPPRLPPQKHIQPITSAARPAAGRRGCLSRRTLIVGPLKFLEAHRCKQAGALHIFPSFRPPHHLPTLFNIIKAWRGLTRIPPKRGENTPRIRANPPKGERIPLESPANPPANPPATSPSPKQGKSERFPGGPQRAPPASSPAPSPLPNQSVHAG